MATRLLGGYWLGIAAVLAALMSPVPALAAPAANAAFHGVWSRTDAPVAVARVSRSWVWGPAAATEPLLESYAESPGGSRVVQYFDKSRMELTHPDGDPASPWYVTNGLLARELVTGEEQLGDGNVAQRAPAAVNVAGDSDDPSGPTYVTFNGLMAAPSAAGGRAVVQTVDRAGVVGADESSARFGVTAVDRGAPTNHSVASVFWAFMTGSGLVSADGALVQEALFPNPFYATGYPLTEAYWATVKVAGTPRQVLVQVFERRVLTYTPSNPDGWQVEAGNVGLHYYQWRYGLLGETPRLTPSRVPVIVLDPGHDGGTGGALGVEQRHTLTTALRLRDKLVAAGYTVYLTRSDEAARLYGDPTLMPPNAEAMPFDYDEGYAHATRALSFRPDLVISIHYNASDSPRAGGLTVFYCDHGGPQSQRLAGYLTSELANALGASGYVPPYAATSEDGGIGKSYGHLATLGNVYSAPFALVGDRLDGIPAVLTEALFETNPSERALIERDDVQERLAAAYLRAIERYFGP